MYGRWIENTLQETYTGGPNKGKPKYRIEDLLGMPVQTRKISMADVMGMPLG